MNSLSAQIRGKKEADPLVKKAKAMAIMLEDLSPDEAKTLIKAAKQAGILDQLREVMGEDRVNALL